METVYSQCLLNCPVGEYDCMSTCVREYDEGIDSCPCNSGCPNGCPCPVYQCYSTTTDIPTTQTRPEIKTSILVLNTRGPLTVPLITDDAGRYDNNFFFMFGENTEAELSCGLIWHNEHYIFGGRQDFGNHQISRVTGCKVQRVGDLDFHFKLGACASVNQNLIYLCFSNYASEKRVCRVSREPLEPFQQITDSIYEHNRIRIAASKSNMNITTSFSSEQNFSADILAVGSITPDHVKAETLLVARNDWHAIHDLPVVRFKVHFEN